MYRKISESRNEERTKLLVLFGIYLLQGILEKENSSTWIVLSVQPVMICVTVILKIGQKMPASASSKPGCGMSSSVWRAVPLL